MATLAQKIECEHRMRRLLADNGMPEPDEVDYGHTCVRFFFDDARACVVVDIDNPDDEATLADLAEAERRAAGEDEDFGLTEAFCDPLSDDPSWN